MTSARWRLPPSCWVVPLRMPVMLPPIGSVQVFEAGGGESVARAAQEFGVLQTLSSVCTAGFRGDREEGPGALAFISFISWGIRAGWTTSSGGPWTAAIRGSASPWTPRPIPAGSGTSPKGSCRPQAAAGSGGFQLSGADHLGHGGPYQERIRHSAVHQRGEYG